MPLPPFVRRFQATDAHVNGAYWCTFVNDRLLLIQDGDRLLLPTSALLEQHALQPDGAALLGYLEDVPCYVARLAEIADQPQFQLVDLRQAFGHLPEHHYSLAGFASQIAHWDRTTRFCPVCGAPTEAVETERAKRCTSCGYLQYPRVSPCIIVLIYRPGQLLLTRQATWTPNMYSLVAGFVEAGESLEQCLRREILEEVGVEVDQVEYLGSQPWPFPHQLMVGFRARYASGEVQVDPAELEDARWFDIDALPTLSSPQSISRQIINWHLASQSEPGLPFPMR
jgi:NAD+ diphosphatase